MDAFLALPRDRQAQLIERAADELGMSPAAIEKDFWVCWAMREMFRSVEGPHLTLKGGTSLSKCWNLIQRFSEDIDLVVDRAHLGFGPENAPETAPSRNEQGRRSDAVLERCKRHVHDVLLPILRDAVRDRLRNAPSFITELDPDAADHQTIILRYESLLASAGHVRPVMKIELGARSGTEPGRSARTSRCFKRSDSRMTRSPSEPLLPTGHSGRRCRSFTKPITGTGRGTAWRGTSTTCGVWSAAG